MTSIQRTFVRCKSSVRTSNIMQVPDFTKYSPIKPVNEELAPQIFEVMRAYPEKSKHINQQHYYHNRTILLQHYLKKKPHPVSLSQLAQYFDDSNTLTRQKIINSSRFVKGELSIRIAHQINLLQQLPFSVVNNFHFNQVYESYYNIFERFRKFPAIRSMEDNYKFTEFLTEILQGFNNKNLPHMIMGGLECTILDLYPQDKMDVLLSELIRSRISRRLIVEEHIGITSNFLRGKKENTLVLGDIFQECSAKDYILFARNLCETFVRSTYHKNIPMPELTIEGATDMKLYFLPAHLKYLFGEILRNTYEETIKDYIKKGLPKPQPIVVTMVQNKESFIFRISDRAGGLAQDDQNIWSFGKSKEQATKSLENFHKLPELQTSSIYDSPPNTKVGKTKRGMLVKHSYENTALEQMSHSNLPETVFKFEKPLIGMLERPFRYKLGIGLATCKVYAEYWNGDLTLHSIPGYGTDTVLKLGNLLINTKKLQLNKV